MLYIKKKEEEKVLVICWRFCEIFYRGCVINLLLSVGIENMY